MGMTIPGVAGGAGADYVSYALALMELAAADGAISTNPFYPKQPSRVGCIFNTGTEAQKRRLLPELMGRAHDWCVCSLLKVTLVQDAAAIQRVRHPR